MLSCGKGGLGGGWAAPTHESRHEDHPSDPSANPHEGNHEGNHGGNLVPNLQGTHVEGASLTTRISSLLGVTRSRHVITHVLKIDLGSSEESGAVATSECEVLRGGRAGLTAWRSSILIVVRIGSQKSEACIRALAAEQGLAVHPWVPSAPSGGVAAKKHVVLAEV